MKQSINQYRNINGIYFECFTSDPSKFEFCKKQCRERGLKYRIIDNQFYRQAL